MGYETGWRALHVVLPGKEPEAEDHAGRFGRLELEAWQQMAVWDSHQLYTD